MVNPKNTVLRTTWIGLAITIAFIAATILLVSFPASQFTGPTAREYAAGIARVIVALTVILVIRQRKWGSNALTWPRPRSWMIILPVAAYSLVVYPLLFTGTLGLNLSQPNLAAGVAFNGFAAGALEELVFRGLILSLLLSGNSDDHNPSITWRAIIISALLFSLPHALNLFAGHAEARVVAQLIWAFLLGIVFACLRMAGRSIWPGCRVAWRYERIRSREQARDRDTTFTGTCCRAGFRSSAFVHLWSNSIAQATNGSQPG